MTAASFPLSASVSTNGTASESFRSKLIEFLLVGGGTLVLLPLAWLLRRAVGLDDAELAAGFVTFYAAYVVNDPHFAVTYLLFYRGAKQRAFDVERPLSQRVRYLVSGFFLPISLVAWGAFALASHSAETLGWMIQLMYLTVGWHYVKQGFGVLSVLSMRRGVRVTPLERRAILFHCYAGWAFAWANPSIPAGEYEEKGVVYHALAHPRSLELATGAALAISSVLLLAVLVLERKRAGRWLPLAPLTGLLVTVWLWTIFSSIDPVLRYFIPALHSIQYFYFVGLMRRNEARAHEGAPTFGKPAAVRLGFLAVSALMLGWFLFRGLPTALDDFLVVKPKRGQLADALGETPYFAVFFVVVSIHHYFMDSVIWRRDNPDTKYFRDVSPEGELRAGV
ncbi:MAG: hypothetical protein ABI461_20915 [Polyangiaceae bacterium]